MLKLRLKIRKLKEEDAGLYSCLSSIDEWRNLSLIVQIHKEIYKPKSDSQYREGLDEEDEVNFAGDSCDDDKPCFTNYTLMHNEIATVVGANISLYCPAQGRLHLKL